MEAIALETLRICSSLVTAQILVAIWIASTHGGLARRALTVPARRP